MNRELEESILRGDSSFYATPGRWKFHRLGVLGPHRSIYKRDGEAVTAAKLGSTASDAIRPDGWNFTNTPRVEKDPRHPDFSRVKSGSIVLNTEQRVEHALDIVKGLHARLSHYGELRRDDATAKGTTDAQLRMDIPDLLKFTIQIGSIGDWFITKQGGNPRPPALDDELFLAVSEHVVRHYGRSMPPRSEWTFKAPPATTNSGFPFFGKHQMLKLAGTLAAANTAAAAQAQGLEICDRLSIDRSLSHALGVSARSGPLAKSVDIRRFTGTGWVKIGEGRGWRQRERVVMMASPGVNRMLEPFYAGLHESRKHIPGLWHAGDADRTLALEFDWSYECDISGYDTSVARALQEHMADLLHRFTPLSREEAEIYLWTESLPLVTPHWGLNGDLATRVTFQGGTRSGLRHTAEIGTIIAVICSLYAAAKQGADWKRWPLIPGMRILHQGDDALIVSETEMDPEAWASAYADCGFKAALIPSDVFLSKHQRATQRTAPRLGRLIQQTLSNENEQTGPFDLALGIHILGFLGRTEGLAAVHPVSQRAFWEACEPVYWMEEVQRKTRPCRDAADFRRVLLEDGYCREAVNRSLEWKQGLGWFQGELRDAEHSPVSKAIVAHALETGLDVEALTALDKRVQAAATWWLNRPWAERLELIVRTQHAKSEGPKALDALFAEVTMQALGLETEVLEKSLNGEEEKDEDGG